MSERAEELEVLKKQSVFHKKMRRFLNSHVDSDITLIYHYTSPAGFQSILDGDEQHKSITLWATRYDCLNDQSEGTIAMQTFHQVCEELRQDNKISENLYGRFLQVKPEAFHGLDSQDQSYDTYICSFTKNPDSLPMWNYYSKGNKFEGFNIGLNMKLISKYFSVSSFSMWEDSIHMWDNTPPIYSPTIEICPVSYDYDFLKSYISKYMLELLNLYSFSNIEAVCEDLSYELARWSMLFKSKSFETEEEMRAIVQIPQNSYSHKKMPVKYRFSNGMIIPYIELKLEKSAVTSVSFGPLSRTKDEKEMQKTVMQQYLTSAGYKKVDIQFSDVPIRF